MKVENSTALANATTEKLRRLSLANEIPQHTQAKRLGIGQQALGRRYKAGDMKLSEFIELSKINDIEPWEALIMANDEIEATE